MKNNKLIFLDSFGTPYPIQPTGVFSQIFLALLQGTVIARFFETLVFRIARVIDRKRLMAKRLTLKEATVERERLYKLLNALPVQSFEFRRNRTRLKAIQDHIYFLYRQVAAK